MLGAWLTPAKIAEPERTPTLPSWFYQITKKRRITVCLYKWFTTSVTFLNMYHLICFFHRLGYFENPRVSASFKSSAGSDLPQKRKPLKRSQDPLTWKLKIHPNWKRKPSSKIFPTSSTFGFHLNFCFGCIIYTIHLCLVVSVKHPLDHQHGQKWMPRHASWWYLANLKDHWHSDILLMEEIRRTIWDGAKTHVNNGFITISTGEFTRFLNHQWYQQRINGESTGGEPENRSPLGMQEQDCLRPRQMKIEWDRIPTDPVGCYRVTRYSGFFRGPFSKSCWRFLGMEETTKTVSVQYSMLMSAGVCVYISTWLLHACVCWFMLSIWYIMYMLVSICWCTRPDVYMLMHIGVCSHKVFLIQLKCALNRPSKRPTEAWTMNKNFAIGCYWHWSQQTCWFLCFRPGLRSPGVSMDLKSAASL